MTDDCDSVITTLSCWADKEKLKSKTNKHADKVFFVEIEFIITDLKKSIAVNYTGILPDLFKENAGVVATGYFDKSKMSLDAYQILAKHDENYVPKEVKKALEKWFQK